MKNYTTEINNTIYLVKEDKGIAINLSTNEVISYDEILRMIKKNNSEFSNQWIQLDIDASLDYYIEEDNLIAGFNFENDYNDRQGDLIRTNYDVIIGIQNNEPYIAREIISKTNISRGIELPIVNDNHPSYISVKTGMDNSLLWYAHNQGDDVLEEVTSALGFTNLGDVYTHKTDTSLYIKKVLIDDVVYYFDRIVYTDQTTTLRKRKSRF